MSTLRNILELAKLGVELFGDVADAVGGAVKRPFVVTMPRPLRGPAHVYPPRGSVLERMYGRDGCMGCDRKDPEHTPLTEPPCPRNRIYPEHV